LVNKTNIIFICLPTPMNIDGSCNLQIVRDVIKDIDYIAGQLNCHKTIAIKSTVLPGTSDKINNQSKNISVLFNPEFLTEANFINDFKNQNRIILGGENDELVKIENLYSLVFPNVPILKTSSTVAEMIKYFTNTYLATKVSFANEMKLICEFLEINYEKVVEYAKYDERLGESHWSVPGPDGHYGFGGSCFPKDVNALISFCKDNNILAKTLMGAWETNLKVRPEKDWEQLKGRAITNNKKDID